LSQQLFFNNLEEFAGNVAFIDEAGKSFSYLDLTRMSKVFGVDLMSRRLVLCLASNCGDFYAGYIGFLRKEIVPLLLPLQANSIQIQNFIDIYNPTYIFIPKHSSFIPLDFKKISSNGTYELFFNESNTAVLHDELALLMTTSGSTGNSKLVRLSYSNLQSNADSIVEYMKLDFKSRAITTLPFSYSYGLSIVNSHLRVGGSIVLNEKSIIETSFWEKYEMFSPSHLGGVPFTYEMLGRFKEKLFANKALKTLTQAGGRLPEKAVKFFAEECKARSIDFYVMYGQTEATARMSYLDCLDAIERPNSIGKPIPGGKFSLIDEKGNEITQNWNEGEIVYEGPNVSFGYANKKSDLSLGDENKGKLYTGDIGVRDDLGFFYIKGRSSRMAKINGIRTNLQEVEDFLLTCNVTSAVLSDDSKIYIFYEGNIREGELKVRIADYLNLRPTSFVLKELESLPRTTSGKVDMGSLGKWI
jgi:long-chain acyl-CoA synthetase